jgi:hypothetical protein
LAHVVGDRVEAAYLRTTLFDRRRKMMDAWAKACSTMPADKTANVALFARGGAGTETTPMNAPTHFLPRF